MTHGKHTRKDAIKLALSNLGLPLNSDNKLCNSYIAGTLTDMSLDEIVNEIAFTKYLHEYTNYPKDIATIVEEFATYGGYYSGILKDASFYAKKRYKTPLTWPWLKDGKT